MDGHAEFDNSPNLVNLAIMFMDNSSERVITAKTSEAFEIQSDRIQGDPVPPLLFNLALEYGIWDASFRLTSAAQLL